MKVIMQTDGFEQRITIFFLCFFFLLRIDTYFTVDKRCKEISQAFFRYFSSFKIFTLHIGA